MTATSRSGAVLIRGGLVLVAILLLQTLAIPARAQADDTAASLFKTYLMWRDIEILNVCNKVRLTSDQAALAAVAIEEPWRDLETIWAVEGSEAMRQAMGKLRAALITGAEVPGELWVEVAEARAAIADPDDGDDDGLERRKAELGDEMAIAFLSVLTPQQMSRLFAPPAEDLAANIAERLGDARAQSPDEWAEFKARIRAEVQKLVAARPLPEGNTLLDDLDAFLERTRKMDTDTYFRERDDLTEELITLLAATAPADTDASRIRARNLIAEWAKTPGLIQLLRDMAVADRTAVAP